MSKTATVNVRIEPKLKHNVEKIMDQLGLTTTQAITLFYKQFEIHKGLPFEVNIPNEETKAAMDEINTNGKNLKSYKNIDELFSELGI